MKISKQNSLFFIGLTFLFGLTLFSGFILSSSSTFADDNDTVVDDVSITIPMACTLSGVGMNTHNATINNGTYASDIGTTTLKAYCNDNEGFAIYAIGYTDNIDGKNVLSNSTLGSNYDIMTGTLTSGNSQWAMKLTAQSNPTPTYPITIENNYNNYHTVPSNYELVAKRTAATDIGTDAEGSTLTSTYQVYISENQPAGSYAGQVKYVMVHPSNTDEIPVRDDQIAVLFDGNGLTFPGGTSTNRVVYGNVCGTISGYVGNTYEEESMSSNITNGGIQNGPYTSSENIFQTITIPGADKVKVVIEYGFTASSIGATIVEGTWDGDWDSLSNANYLDIYDDNVNISGTKTFAANGDTITISVESWDSPVSGYDKGFYARIYPVYDTEQPNTTYEELPTSCGIAPVSGAYAETTTWKGKWDPHIYIDDNVYFADEMELLEYIKENSSTLFGTTMKVDAYNPFAVFYDGNNATAGTMDGFYTLYSNDISDTETLTAPNFYKTGYGFAGWSEDPNATTNSDSRIFGPNEEVNASKLDFSNNKATTLYAVWVPNSGNMQSWSGCSGMSINQVTALTDIRDNNVYAIGKLADGNCWMMENLRLDTANSSDSSKAQGFGGVFSGLADSEPYTNFVDSTIPNTLYNTNNITGDDQASRFPRYNNQNTADYAKELTSKNQNIYGYGNYYSFAAAKANTIESPSDSSNTSICPTGWKLPKGNTLSVDGSFGYLNYKINNDSSITDHTALSKIKAYPNNFIYSGSIYKTSYANGPYLRGTVGVYWSSTASSIKKQSYLLQLSDTSHTVLPGNAASSNHVGRSVRCLLEN